MLWLWVALAICCFQKIYYVMTHEACVEMRHGISSLG